MPKVKGFGMVSHEMTYRWIWMTCARKTLCIKAFDEKER